MPQFDVAHIREQGQDIIIVLVAPTCGQMAQQEQKFIEGAVTRGIKRDKAQQIFSLMKQQNPISLWYDRFLRNWILRKTTTNCYREFISPIVN